MLFLGAAQFQYLVLALLFLIFNTLESRPAETVYSFTAKNKNGNSVIRMGGAAKFQREIAEDGNHLALQPNRFRRFDGFPVNVDPVLSKRSDAEFEDPRFFSTAFGKRFAGSFPSQFVRSFDTV
ncbi:hypothetical protein Ddc_05331 [Ditylenchus destructor]|nr:hypothetical protein Ddc_05331 [Ditylenchus destructor]